MNRQVLRGRCPLPTLLFPVVPAGIPLPMRPFGPVGLYGTKSLSDLTPIGPVGLYSDPVGPYVARGPVGSYGTSSPCDTDQSAADGPVGPYVARGPVDLYGTLSPSDFD